jgi:hypothetical protein
MLFRPEQEHGFSGKHNIVVPMARWNSDVDESLGADQFSFDNLQDHLVITAAAGGVDARILAQHCRNTERIPDAVAPPLALANAHGKGGRDGREWRRTPELSIFLQDECMRLAQLLQPGPDFAHGAGMRISHFGDFGRCACTNEVPVDVLAEAHVEGHGSVIHPNIQKHKTFTTEDTEGTEELLLQRNNRDMDVFLPLAIG